jgi:hypothetical protein
MGWFIFMLGLMLVLSLVAEWFHWDAYTLLWLYVGVTWLVALFLVSGVGLSQILYIPAIDTAAVIIGVVGFFLNEKRG